MADPLSRPASEGGSVDDLDRRRAELEELRQRVMNVGGHALRAPMATLRGHIEAVMTDAIGLGVGLPVARRLAEHAGGALHLEAGPAGHGVTAVLAVPAP